MALNRKELLALVMAGIPPVAGAAEEWPLATDMIRVRAQRPLVPGGEAATVSTVARFVWVTPQLGVSAFASLPADSPIEASCRLAGPGGLGPPDGHEGPQPGAHPGFSYRF